MDRKQRKGESISEYGTALRELAPKVEFGGLEKGLLKDFFIHGVWSHRIKDALRVSGIETLDEAVVEAQRLEGPEEMHREVCEAKKTESKDSKECRNCGKNHSPGMNFCRARGAKCRGCGFIGHFENKCWRNNNSKDSENKTVRAYKVNRSYQDLLVGGKKIKFLIDTGANRSIIGWDQVKKLGWSKDLEYDDTVIRCFGGTRVPVEGKIKKKVQAPHQEKEISFLIVKEGGEILGKTDCEQLDLVRLRIEDLDINKVMKVNKVNYVSPFIFRLEIKPGLRPFVARERPIPYGMRKAVELEIDSLVEDGILVPTEITDWCSPLVAVRENTGKVRLCGDSRRLNFALREDKFPLPSI